MYDSADIAFIDREFESLINSKAKIKVIKYGEVGCLYLDENNQYIFNNKRIIPDDEVIDKTGAGDVLIGSFKEVKEKVIQIQRDFGNANDVVMDGRDIGTRIFSNAEIKFYLETSPEVRAKRKFLEGKDKDLSYKDILKKLLERDKIEIASKSILIPKDAFKINTDNMTFEEVSEKLIQITMQKMNVIER